MALLYDFIYRDSNRLNSYYAQIFSGRLVSLEKIDINTESKEKGGGISAYIAKGDMKNSQQTQSSSKEFIDPHDLAITDILTKLLGEGLTSRDIQNTSHGSLALTKGTVMFIDKYILEVTGTVADALIQAEKAKGKQGNRTTIQLYENVKLLIPKLILPSCFLFQAENGVQLVGTIKDNGLEEPISSYYFKHGINGIPDIYCLGIKESSIPILGLSNTPLLSATQQLLQIMNSLLFPATAIRVTPIAMFRKLHKDELQTTN